MYAPNMTVQINSLQNIVLALSHQIIVMTSASAFPRVGLQEVARHIVVYQSDGGTISASFAQRWIEILIRGDRANKWDITWQNTATCFPAERTQPA